MDEKWHNSYAFRNYKDTFVTTLYLNPVPGPEFLVLGPS
jgi:hypothetical protein